ncbi:unnamed protein product, partial [Polarella glacialis]
SPKAASGQKRAPSLSQQDSDMDETCFGEDLVHTPGGGQWGQSALLGELSEVLQEEEDDDEQDQEKQQRRNTDEPSSPKISPRTESRESSGFRGPPPLTSRTVPNAGAKRLVVKVPLQSASMVAPKTSPSSLRPSYASQGSFS